jgi:DNA-binding CsgD family transcriptional regulator
MRAFQNDRVQCRPSTPSNLGKAQAQRRRGSEIEILTLQALALRERAGREHHKTHIRNIYRKLGAHSRTQALVRARELNLL